MANNKEFVAAVFEKYLEYHVDFYGALGTMMDDLNEHLIEKHKRERNELILVDDILEEVEKINAAVGLLGGPTA